MTLRASYFDGRSTRVQTVALSLHEHELVIEGEGLQRRIAFAQITVDERLGSAPRRLHLPGGAFCEVADLAALDTFLAAASHRDAWVDRLQRHRVAITLALIACALIAGALYRWGLPWAAAQGARRLPASVGQALSAQALKVLDAGILEPSQIPASRQHHIAERFHALRLPGGGSPRSTLLFRRSPQIGANAFTLPDGSIVLLDGLISALQDDRQVLAVLAHELGHAQGRHSLQLLLEGSAASALLALYVGDISQLLAAAPAVLLHAKYSQSLEQQADDYAASVLRLNGLSPALLADAIGKLVRAHPGPTAMPYLATHPPSEARMRHLRRLAATPGAP